MSGHGDFAWRPTSHVFPTLSFIKMCFLVASTPHLSSMKSECIDPLSCLVCVYDDFWITSALFTPLIWVLHMAIYHFSGMTADI